MVPGGGACADCSNYTLLLVHALLEIKYTFDLSKIINPCATLF